MTTISYWPIVAREKMAELFTEALITDIPDGDPTKVARVVVGRLRESAAKTGPYIEIYENDPEQNGWEHHLVTNGNNDNAESRYSDTMTRTRSLWNRRFTISVIVFMRGIDTREADSIRGTIVSRIEKVLLDHHTLDGLTDEGGETAYGGRIVKEDGRESGADKTPIWRTRLWLEYRTLRRQLL
jgi:hypothetical protein